MLRGWEADVDSLRTPLLEMLCMFHHLPWVPNSPVCLTIDVTMALMQDLHLESHGLECNKSIILLSLSYIDIN